MPMLSLVSGDLHTGVRGTRNGGAGRARALAALACATLCLAVVGGLAHGASSNVTITASILSATNVDATACSQGTANVTDFGSLLPNTATVTSGDCTVTFGSSNDTAQLRLGQTDVLGSGMWQAADGPLDTSFSGDGMVNTGIAAAADIAYGIAVQPNGRLVMVGSYNNGTTNHSAAARYLADGTLDTSFDTDGKVTTSTNTGYDELRDVALQSDGKIVTGGAGNNGAGLTDFTTVRYNSDGSLDTTYDTDGIAITSFTASDDFLRAIALQPDGKIVAAGFAQNATNDFAVARYNTDGSLDTSFSGDGKLTQAGGAQDDYGRAVTLQSDGKILVAGGGFYAANCEMQVMRFLADGTLDTSFDTDGIAYVPVATGTDNVQAVHQQPDGKILLVGYGTSAGNDDLALVRLTSTGALDTSFDTDGKVLLAVGAGNDRLLDAQLLPDGRIFATGYTNNGTDDDMLFVRFTAAGALDTTFDIDGIKQVALGAGLDQANSATWMSDGTFAIAGRSSNGANDDFAAIKLRSTTVSDYVMNTTDFDQGASAFGACLRAVGGSTTAQWTMTGTCTTADGAQWNDVPAASEKVAYSASTGIVTASASIRFGVRGASSQRPGAYFAPVTFDVLAPNA